MMYVRSSFILPRRKRDQIKPNTTHCRPRAANKELPIWQWQVNVAFLLVYLICFTIFFCETMTGGGGWLEGRNACTTFIAQILTLSSHLHVITLRKREKQNLKKDKTTRTIFKMQLLIKILGGEEFSILVSIDFVIASNIF